MGRLLGGHGGGRRLDLDGSGVHRESATNPAGELGNLCDAVRSVSGGGGSSATLETGLPLRTGEVSMEVTRNGKLKHAMRHEPRAYPAIADVGIVLLDQSLRPVAFHKGAAEMFHEDALRSGSRSRVRSST